MQRLIHLFIAAAAFLALSSSLHSAWAPINNGFTELHLSQLQLLPTSQSRFIYVATQFGGLYQVHANGVVKEIGAQYFEGEKIFSILIDPQHENIVYVATGSKGILKSNDNGLTWKVINNGLKIHAGDFTFIAQLFIDPQQTQQLYALDPYFGIFTSTNAGKQWTQLNDPTHGDGTVFFQMQISPMQSENMIVQTPIAHYLTMDGADNWDKITGSMPQDYTFSATLPNVLYGRKKNQFLFSSTLGKSWQTLYNSPENTDLKTYLINNDNEQEIFLAAPEGLLYSDTGGKSWKNINESALINSFTQLYQDAQNKKLLYARATQNSDNIFLSTDSGLNWLAITPHIATPNIVSFAIDPHDPNIKYAGTFNQGLWMMRDGKTWQRTSLPVKDTEQVKQVLIDPVHSENVLALVNERGSLYCHVYHSQDAGNTWQAASPPTSSDFMLYDLAYNLQNTNEVYAAGLFNFLFKSSDGGATWFLVYGQYPDISARADTLAINPKNTNEILIGGAHSRNLLYQSQDAGKTWQALSAFHDNTWRNFAVNSIAFDPSNPNIIYVLADIRDKSSESGYLFKSIDDGKNWQQVGNHLPLMPIDADNMQSLVIDPLNPNNIYIALGAADMWKEISNYGNGGIYVSHDGGVNFQKLMGLNNNFVRALIIDNHDLYAATIGSGVWKTNL